MKTLSHTMLKFAIVFIMTAFALPITAQTSGDKLYNQGLYLQKTMTARSQRAAIAKFRSAKKLYDSDAKKKQCDDAIAVSNNIIKGMRNGTRKDGISGQEQNSRREASTSLKLDNYQFNLSNEANSVTVNVDAADKKWEAKTIDNTDGTSFIAIRENSDGKSFDIYCIENKTTRQRTQQVKVRSDAGTKTVTIVQAGIPIKLTTEEALVEFSYKGGDKTIEVYCNSEKQEKDNNNRNWRVVSKPEWVEIVGEEQKKKSLFGKLVDKGKNLVKKESAATDDPTMITSLMNIIVTKLPSKNSPARKGEIVIASDNQEATIMVVQQ